MSHIDYKQNPSLKHADILQSVAEPLKAHDITFFGYTAVDNMNRAYCLGSKIDYAENYLRQTLAQSDIHTLSFQHNSKPQYFYWDYCQLDAENEKLYQVAHEFDQSHTLTITHSSEHLIQCYHFSGKNNHHQLNQYCYENLDALHLYIDYFNQCLKNIPELASVFQHPINIDKKSDTLNHRIVKYLKTNFNPSLYQNSFSFSQANQLLLSKSERECLRWIHHGKPYEIIAKLMDVNRKTIERNVASIKEKYQCYTLYQLGEKVAENKLNQLLY